VLETEFSIPAPQKRSFSGKKKEKASLNSVLHIMEEGLSITEKNKERKADLSAEPFERAMIRERKERRPGRGRVGRKKCRQAASSSPKRGRKPRARCTNNISQKS